MLFPSRVEMRSASARSVRLRPLLRPLPLFSLVAAAVFAVALLGAKIGAAGPKATGSDGGVAFSIGGKPSKGKRGKEVTPAASASTLPIESAAPIASVPAPLDYAVVQSVADLDPTLSDEERNAIGTGKVPIHREGKFRSPFAHPRFGRATVVKVGFVLNNVREYDIQHGSFKADFFLSLTADKDVPADLTLAFTNGQEIEQVALAETPTFRLYRVNGSFSSPVDLRKYPFDTQRLDVNVEDLRAGVDQIVFVADQNRTALDEGFQVAGWNIATLGASAYRHLYPTRFDRDDLYVSRYKFTLGLDRFGISAALSVFVPALVIILISLTGLWVPPEELEVRSNTGAPMLAAAVLFHYSLIQALPATGYLTRADKVMMAVYACLLLNMFSTWLFVIVPEKQLQLTFRLGRALVPPASAVVVALSFFL